MSARPSPMRRDWLGKSLAGALPGLALALALSGVFAWTGPGGAHAPNKYQLTMWLVVPLWAAILSLVFLFRSALQAWCWLGGASLLALGALFALRHFLS